MFPEIGQLHAVNTFLLHKHKYHQQIVLKGPELILKCYHLLSTLQFEISEV
jgi:hypothetical protein